MHLFVPGKGNYTYRAMCSGGTYSLREVSSPVVSSSPSFDFSRLLNDAIQCEKPNYDDTEGYAFEPVPIDLLDSTRVPMPMPSPFGSPLSPTTSPGSSRPPSPLNLPPLVCPASSSGAGTKAAAYRKAQSKKKRAKKRQQLKEAQGPVGYLGQQHIKKNHISSSKALVTTLDMRKIRVASTGFTGLRDTEGVEPCYKLSELVGKGSKWEFDLITWDGRTSRPILSETNHVIAVLVGRPKDATEEEWQGLQGEAHQVIQHGRIRCTFSKKQAKHRRGGFSTLTAGSSFGGGQKVPGTLVNTPINAEVLAHIFTTTAIKRLAGLASSAFATWAPRLFQYYNDHMTSLYAHHPSLRRNFHNSIWAAATINFGPQTVCFAHRDHANLAFGWCTITALGNFNPKLGGHLILWDMKMVIEFPPGSTILIPSAALRHSNTPLHAGETRSSFTQFTAAGLFRWVEHGFRTAAQFQKDDEKGKVRFDNASAGRWEMGLNLFSTMDELCK